jgi:hypothetical protein
MEFSKKSPSKADLQKYTYTKELREWLAAHNNPAGAKYKEEFDNVQNYKKFMKSITMDRNPIDTACLILSTTEDLPPETPLSISRVGGVVKQRLQEELAKNPQLSALSPAVVLAQKRRKEVIALIETGNWPLDYSQPSLIIQEDEPELSATSVHQPSSSYKDPLNRPTKFQPKWDNYDTMKARWKYLHPQTKQLATQSYAPTTSSSFVKSRGTRLYGKQTDFDYYHSQMDSRTMRSGKSQNNSFYG